MQFNFLSNFPSLPRCRPLHINYQIMVQLFQTETVELWCLKWGTKRDKWALWSRLLRLRSNQTRLAWYIFRFNQQTCLLHNCPLLKENDPNSLAKFLQRGWGWWVMANGGWSLVNIEFTNIVGLFWTYSFAYLLIVPQFIFLCDLEKEYIKKKGAYKLNKYLFYKICLI